MFLKARDLKFSLIWFAELDIRKSTWISGTARRIPLRTILHGFELESWEFSYSIFLMWILRSRWNFEYPRGYLRQFSDSLGIVPV